MTKFRAHKCVVCGSKFIGKRINAKTCSKICRSKHKDARLRASRERNDEFAFRLNEGNVARHTLDRLMKDIPIIFSAPMILALLAGRKTMTRRLAWQDRYFRMDGACEIRCKKSLSTHSTIEPSHWQRVKPGDRLYVRENFYTEGGHEGNNFGYAADLDPTNGLPRLTPCIYMPRHLSRLTLVVTATKIERLNEISEADARAEGIELPPTMSGLDRSAYRHCFGALWRTLHGKGPNDFEPWDANPEVVALTFTAHKQNIDALPKAAAA